MQQYSLVYLHDYIVSNEIGEEEIKSILSDFSCPKNQDIEKFLKEKALAFEKIGLARTILVFKECDDIAKFVGYFSIAIKQIDISEISKEDRRKVFKTRYSLGNEIPTILIGQLAKNFTNNNNLLIKGNDLLYLAFDYIKEMSKNTPSFVVSIDCENNEKIKYFYESVGFKFLKYSDNDLLCYIIPTKEILKK